MRQDIVNVLKTSHMDLVRALIGLPPYAVHRWHMAYLKMLAMFAFRYVGCTQPYTVPSCYYGNHVAPHDLPLTLTITSSPSHSSFSFHSSSHSLTCPLSPLKSSSSFSLIFFSILHFILHVSFFSSFPFPLYFPSSFLPS